MCIILTVLEKLGHLKNFFLFESLFWRFLISWLKVDGLPLAGAFLSHHCRISEAWVVAPIQAIQSIPTLTLLFFMKTWGTWAVRPSFPPGHIWVFNLLNVKDQAVCLPHVCGSPSFPGFCLLHTGLLAHETDHWGFLCGSSTYLLNSDFYTNVTIPPLRFILWFVFVLHSLLSFWVACFRMSPVGARFFFEKLTVRLTFPSCFIHSCPVFLSSHSLLYSCASRLCFLDFSWEGFAGWQLTGGYFHGFKERA